MKNSMNNRNNSSFFQTFVQSEAFGGVLLVFAAAIAFSMANSPLSEFYFQIKKTYFGIAFGDWELKKALYHWINDGLMVIFFLLVGLEIKRELIQGELSRPRDAALAVFAALGGMIVPALIYVALNFNGDGLSGWGIPMATDIAFALGIMALLGKRVPIALKVFLTALAIVDDLGAVLVIALFYTESLNITALISSLVVLAIAALYGYLSGRKLLVFAIFGVIAWYYMLKSGVHATVAGVLLAFTVPLSTKHSYNRSDEHHSPLHTLEHGLEPWVNYFIMPVFALTNAGVVLSGESFAASPILLGCLFGLVLGKPIGVFLFSWLAVQCGLASLPNNVSWKQIFATGLLAGIGFTMSFFIAVLAFGQGVMLDQAKLGILGASIIAAVAGLTMLYTYSKQSQSIPN